MMSDIKLEEEQVQYERPTLTNYGSAKVLTAAGSGTMTENAGLGGPNMGANRNFP